LRHVQIAYYGAAHYVNVWSQDFLDCSLRRTLLPDRPNSPVLRWALLRASG